MNRSVFIYGVSFIQLFRALMLLISDAANGVTSINSQLWVFGNRHALAAYMVTAVVLALWRETHSAPKAGRSMLWYMPQFSLTVIGAVGAMVCMIQGSYADGVPRPFTFMAADQIIYPLLAWGYWRAFSQP